MREILPNKRPVIIGGVGGSGTRVVAEIVSLFGIYLGGDLNGASDNLTYTLLFKRPKWFRKHYPVSRYFLPGFSIMQKTLLTGEPVSLGERIFLSRAVKQMSKYGHNPEGQGRGDWPYERLKFIRNSAPLDPSKYLGWGWKEPNSHLALEAFPLYFPDFRYIHTVRHGLDMAFSGNQQQLNNWASLFNIEIPEDKEDIPGASFRFWVEANRRALMLGNKFGNERFLLVNFDKLCSDPLKGIKEIVDFLGVSPSEELMATASMMPVRPQSTGRYKDHGGIVYDPGDLDLLRELGFEH
jgi:hypothetical protein